MLNVSFYGAAKTVTGSNYLIQTDTSRFVLDCGMFQGPDVEHLNLERLEYDASKVDFVLLTHAHIDHCGMLPKLYRSGFRGKIFATSHTIQIATLLLLDSAKIQENNFQKGQSFGAYTNKVGFAFNSLDALETIKLFSPVNFDEDIHLSKDIKARFIRAGHILGAASIYLEVNDQNKIKKLLFSGDIGRVEQPLIESFSVDTHLEPDYIFMESLYGGEYHPNRHQSVREFIVKINETLKKGGNIFIPAFSVQRTQEVLRDLMLAMDANELSDKIPVFLDSPLAQEVCRIYTESLQNTEKSIFTFDSLRYVKKFNQSKAIHKTTRQIVIAGSGMASGGRILNHLVSALPHSKNSVIFVGYQAEGTLGKELADGAKKVTIDKTVVEVKAKIEHFQGFSAHGDTADYEKWFSNYNSASLKKVFLVHAEEIKSKRLASHFAKNFSLNLDTFVVPGFKENYEML